MEISELIVALKPQLSAQDSKKAGEALEQSLNKSLGKVGENFTRNLSKQLGGIDLSGFTDSMMAGAAAFTALLDIGKFAISASVEMAHLGTEIARNADKAEMARDKFQLYSQAAKESGVDTHQFVLAMKMMNKNIYQAITKPTGDAAMSFRAMGVATTDASGKIRQTDSVLGDLMDQFQGMEETPARAALATKIFGIRGHEMIPFLIQGRGALEDLKEAMEAYNATISGESIQDSLDFTKATNRLQLAWMGFKNSLSELGIIKVITWGIEKLTDVVAWFGKGLQQMKQYTEEGHAAAFLLEVGLGTLTAAALFLGGSLLATVLPALLSIAGAVVAATWPFLLMGAAIAFVVDDFLAFIDGGDSVLGTIVKFFNTPSDFPLLELFKSLFNMIFDIGNPDSWSRIWRAIKSLLLDPVFGALDMLAPLLSKLGIDVKTDFLSRKDLGVNESTGNMSKLAVGTVAGAVGSQFGLGSTAMQATNYATGLSAPAAGTSASGGTNLSQKNDVKVEVNVSSNASPEEIKKHAKDAVIEAHEEIMSHAQQAVEQGTH